MIHLQQPVNDWLQAVQRLPAGAVVKAMDNVQALAEAKTAYPHIKTCLRHWYDTGQVFGGTWDDNVNRARAFFATFIDGTFAQYASKVDYVEEFNEYLASSHTGEELLERVTWAAAVAQVWKNEYRTQARYAHIRLVLTNTAVGNNIDRNFARVASENDCVMGYHAYDHWINGVRDPGSWPYHCGRWATMDADWVAHGYTVDFLFTEAGLYEGVLTGWRHQNCLGGDVNKYVAAMRQWVRELMATQAGQQGRLKGACLFNTGGTNTWAYYETRQPELNQLAEMWAQEWKPGTVPPPPPPDPDPCRGTPRVQYARRYNAIPSDASEQQAIDIFLEGWRNGRQTAGGSYDDAGVGDLDQRLAVLWNIPLGNRLEFTNWYATHYPGVVVQFRELAPDFQLTHWPTIARYVTQVFGANPEYYAQFGLPGHEGVDISAPQDTPVKSAVAGTVIRADYHDNYGWHVRLEHSGGAFHTIYAHLTPQLNVIVGQSITGGYKLGYSGNTGNSTGYHLHFGMKRFPVGQAGWPFNIIDPTPYLNEIP